MDTDAGIREGRHRSSSLICMLPEACVADARRSNHLAADMSGRVNRPLALLLSGFGGQPHRGFKSHHLRHVMSQDIGIAGPASLWVRLVLFWAGWASEWRLRSFAPQLAATPGREGLDHRVGGLHDDGGVRGTSALVRM